MAEVGRVAVREKQFNNMGEKLGLNPERMRGSEGKKETEFNNTPASLKEVEGFRKKIKENVREKAAELKIPVATLIHSAGLSLKGLKEEIKIRQSDSKADELGPERKFTELVRLGLKQNPRPEKLKVTLEQLRLAEKFIDSSLEKVSSRRSGPIKPERILPKISKFLEKHPKEVRFAVLCCFLVGIGAFGVSSGCIGEPGGDDLGEKTLKKIDPTDKDKIDKERVEQPISEEGFVDLEGFSHNELFEKLSEYPKKIEKSKKQTPEDFIEDLSGRKDFDSLVFGARYGGDGRSDAMAAGVLEKLKEKGKKISVIGFDWLSYTNPRHVEAIEKFNKGELSVEELKNLRVGMVVREELFSFAKKNSIKIAGLEEMPGPGDMEHDMLRKDLARYSQISKRTEDLLKENKENGIAVFFVAQPHATIDPWQTDYLLYHLREEGINTPSKEEVLENGYTITEYLRRKGKKPVGVQIEDWKTLTGGVRWAAYNVLQKKSGKNPEEAGKIMREKWQLKEESSFLSPYPGGKKDNFVLVIPGYSSYS